MKTLHFKVISIFFIFTLTIGCSKDFLDKKPAKSAIVPSKLSDYRSLLDNPTVMALSNTPTMRLLSSDDFIAPDNTVKALSLPEKGAYLWDKDMEPSTVDWNRPYGQVFYSNIVLDGLIGLTEPERNSAEYNAVKGTALFLRSFAFFNLLESFTKPYHPENSKSDPGIPLRLSSDVNIRPGRGTVSACYEQVISDLKEAAALLPVTESYKSRPSKAAAFALLARVNLVMENFRDAGAYADESLKLNAALIDYRSLSPTAARPFPLALPNGNTEILFYGSMAQVVFTLSTTVSVPSQLYKEYQAGDLRKSLFFTDKGNDLVNFKGSYSGDTYFFSGLATDEQYLIRAECYARMGNTELAMTDLNNLLANRWATGFVKLTAQSDLEALAIILKERRKELIGRGLRFSDLRRLNRDAATRTTLTRVFEGKTYTLLPEDNRYVFPIPLQEIMLTGITQNDR